jgi:hypothetical protein
MTTASDRSFAVVVVTLSLVAALFCLTNFDELHWLEVILSTVTISATALIVRRLWLNRDDSERRYFIYFILMLAFWIVVWFWYADDFCPYYWALILNNSIQYSLLCTAFYWLGQWRQGLRPYVFCLYIGLAGTFVLLPWRGQCVLLVDNVWTVIWVIPFCTLFFATPFALIWRFVLRHVWRALRPETPSTPGLERVVRVCPNGHKLSLPRGKTGKVTCPTCGTLFATVT